MTPRAVFHAIDACTYTAGPSRKRKSYGWAWSVALILAAVVAWAAL